MILYVGMVFVSLNQVFLQVFRTDKKNGLKQYCVNGEA